MKQPQHDPSSSQEVITEALSSILVVIEGPGDATVRPRRPNNPRFWPEGVALPKPPADERKAGE